MARLSAGDCARLIGVKLTTWRSYVARGQAPAPVGEQPRTWDEAEVRAWAFPPIPSTEGVPAGQWGAASGHGRLGILDTAPDGRIICHECGRAVWHLTTHIVQAHHLDPTAYRQAHGLPRSLPLEAADLLARQHAQWEQHRTEQERSLAAHRNPDRARAATSRHEQSIHQRHALSGSRGRPLTPTEVRSLAAAGQMSPLEWGRVAQALCAQSGVTLGSILAATGMSKSRAQQRMRRARYR